MNKKFGTEVLLAHSGKAASERGDDLVGRWFKCDGSKGVAKLKLDVPGP